MSDPAATRTAATARFIARCLLVAANDGRYAVLLPSGDGARYKQLLLAAGDQRFVHAAENRAFRAVFQMAVDLVLPGVILHYLARKRCLENWLRQTCDPEDPAKGHCMQVVVIGAGLDTLAWRLHGQRPDLTFIELDRPAALDIKERAMAAAGSRRRNLTFLPADLGRETLTDALRRSAVFDPAVPTLFIAEGLLMYLPPTRVRSLFLEIAALRTASVAHRFAFTFMETRADGRIRFRRSNPLVSGWLGRRGEPFRWSHAPDTLTAFLEPMGFVLRELVSDDTLRARDLALAGFADAPLAMGEWLAFAQTCTDP